MAEYLDTDPDNLAVPARFEECKTKGHRPLAIADQIVTMPLTHQMSQRQFGEIRFCRRCGLMYWEMLEPLKGAFIHTEVFFGAAQPQVSQQPGVTPQPPHGAPTGGGT